MTREEIKKAMRDTEKEAVLKNLHKLLSLVEGHSEYVDCINYAIKALEQEPCGDCISRTEAIKCLECDFDITGKENMKTVVNYINSAHDKIMNLPRVKQEPRKGEWCPQNDDYFDWYECSECGYGREGEMQYSSEYDVRTNYCPNCGAKMAETEDA